MPVLPLLQAAMVVKESARCSGQSSLLLYVMALSRSFLYRSKHPIRHAPLRRLMPYKPPPDMSKFLLSPMPGLLVRLSVAPGDAVEAGQELAVVEAMKMENVLRATSNGTVKSAHASQGESLAVDQAILEFE